MKREDPDYLQSLQKTKKKTTGAGKQGAAAVRRLRRKYVAVEVALETEGALRRGPAQGQEAEGDLRTGTMDDNKREKENLSRCNEENRALQPPRG